MEAGKRVNVDDPSVASFHRGEIERVGYPRPRLDPLEILARVEGINVNPRLGHSPGMFGISPTIGRWSTDPAHPGEDRLAIEEECWGSVMRLNLGHQTTGRCLRRILQPCRDHSRESGQS